MRGLAKPSDLRAALDELGIGQAQPFEVTTVEVAEGVCVFCATAIDPEQDYQRTAGWTRKREGGGANQITLRETAPEWACASCVGKARRGVAPGQQALG